MARAGEPALLLMLDIDHFKKRQRHPWPCRRRPGAQGRGAARCWTACGRWTRWRASAARSSPSSCPTARRPSARRWPSGCAAASRRMPVSVGPAQQIQVTVSIGGAFAPQWVRSSPAAVDRARRPAALPRQGRGPQPRVPRAVGGVGGQRRGEGAAVRHLAVPGPRMSAASGQGRQQPPTPAADAAARIIAVTSGKGGVGKTFVVGQPGRRAGAAGRARAGARRRPRPGQPRRGAQPVPEDHAARRVHRQELARRRHPAGAGRLLGAAGRLGHGRVLAPDARGARPAAAGHRHGRRRASTTCCSTPAPASPTWCCTPCRWPTRCWWWSRPSRPR